MSEVGETVDYTSSMHAILERPLTPRVIEQYAQTALHDLVELVDDVTTDYHAGPTFRFDSGAETEDAALYYFGLPEIEDTLQRIDNVDQRINALNEVIASAYQSKTVITPPASSPPIELCAGDTPYEKPKEVPRLKTILFILEEEFDIDVHTPDAIELELGALRNGAWRHHGYYFLNIPDLNRTVLVCDETDNATYVFANDKRLGLDLTDEALKDLTKPELEEYISAFPGLGARIVYSDTYVDNVTNALRSTEYYEETVHGGKSYLAEKAPKGYKSVDKFSRDVNVGSQTMRERVISSMSDRLGKIALHQYSSRVTSSLSPDQQSILLDELDRQGMLVAVPSEKYPQATKASMSRIFRVSKERIVEAVAALNADDELGPRQRYRFQKTRDEGFDPWQQNKVFDWLWEQQYVRPQPPETIISVAGMAALFGVTDKVICRVITEVGDTLGPTDEYKFSSQISPGYDPWQQDMVFNHLNTQRHFAPNAPDGIWSETRMHKEWGVNHRELQEAIRVAATELGESDYWKFNGKPTIGYDERQRSIIRHTVETQRKRQ